MPPVKTILTLLLVFVVLNAYGQNKQPKTQVRRGMANELAFIVPSFAGFSEAKAPGLGLTYRKYFTKNGLFSGSVTGYMGYFQDERLYYKSYCPDCNYSEGSLFFGALGVQYHPFGNQRFINYSVGLLCNMGTINQHRHLGTPNASGPTTEDLQYRISGAAISNDLLLNNRRHPYGLVGFHFAYGYNFSEQDAKSFYHLGLMLGTRF